MSKVRDKIGWLGEKGGEGAGVVKTAGKAIVVAGSLVVVGVALGVVGNAFGGGS